MPDCLTAPVYRGGFFLTRSRGKRVLQQALTWRGKPAELRCDNGPEYISEGLNLNAPKNGGVALSEIKMTVKSINWEHLSQQKHFCAQKMARYLYPDGCSRKTFNRGKFVLRSLLYRPQLNRVFTLFQAEPLRALPARHPELLDKPLRPYCFACSTVTQRVEMQEMHYRLLLARYPTLIEPLYLGLGIELGRYSQSDCRILLCYDQTFRREAELALSIVNGRGERLYSCAFSLAGSETELALVIGSVQGPEPGVAQPQEQVRALTKAGHGLRPKSLVVMLVLALAEAMGARRVSAVRMRAHIFQARRYSKKKKACLQADYDALWQEFGAVSLDANFVRLQPAVRKPLEEVAAKKRAMYQRRYQWLDELTQACQGALGQSCISRPIMNTDSGST